jgi:YjbE family integral membrane protein
LSGGPFRPVISDYSIHRFRTAAPGVHLEFFMPFGIDFAIVAAYLQIIAINVVLSGDNVIVVGMAAAGLPPDLRGKAIMVGIGAATIIRILFAIIATQLLQVTGLLLAGGLLLLWVCWKMYEELRAPQDEAEASAEAALASEGGKTLRAAVIQIILADVSMSLDNVLAVAGAAKQDLFALVFGLGLSVLLMGVASALIAKLLARYRWITWIGLLIIVYVAVTMIYNGGNELLGYSLPHIPLISEGEAGA